MKTVSESDDETRELGRRLGKHLKRGDTVCLYGDLGTGKTTMVKGIASALGINEREISSASFTIVAEHGTAVPFYHIDLYRLKPEDVPDIGLREYLDSDGISVIEWAERAEAEIPERCIKVYLTHSGDKKREIVIEGIEF